MKPLHPISASLTVLAGLVLSGAAMRGDQTPLATESAKPAAQVRLTKSDAAVFARDARKGVNVEMPTGVELTLIEISFDTTTEYCCADAAPWLATTALSRSTAQ